MRRRFARARKTARKSYSGFKARAKRRSGSKSSNGIKILDVYAIGYGAVRQYLAQLVQPLTSKLPFGGLADNIVMGAVNYGAYKFIPMPMVKEIAKKGLIIENAMVGAELVGMVQGNTSSGSNAGVTVL